MTRGEQEQLVERYLSGTMTSAEEEEFFIQMAISAELRTTLKAQQIVDSAIRKHRDAASQTHRSSRPRLTSTPGGAFEHANDQASEDDTNRKRRAGVMWWVSSIAALSVLVGTIIIAPMIGSNGDANRTGLTRSGSPAIVAHTAPDAGTVAMPLATGLPAIDEDPASQHRDVAQTHIVPARTSRSGHNNTRFRTVSQSHAGIAARTQTSDNSAGSAAGSRPTSVDAAPSHIPVRDGNLKVRVRVEMPH